ncbi:MAG: PAS domain S-box protein, partial [Bacteroidota bacterium]|nr:PAS domain S-box protein [Bacteroidota bacterium]MDX5430848.1 PAS domain S-box protein [Bacteroidota bacterium]MDX5469592.1 PAS domain S-box protein [Bacteroidota bacterium]
RFELAVFLIVGLLLLLELLLVVRPLLLGYKIQNEELLNLNEELRAKQESLNENIARLEEAYQEKAELASQLLINSLVIENSNDFIGLTDDNFRISYINEAGRKMTNLPEISELKERRITEVLDNETARRYAREIIPQLRKGKSWSGRLFLQNSETKELIPVQSSFFPVVGNHGEIIAYACIQIDITEVLHRETELQMLTEELQASQEELRVQLEEQTRLNDLVEESESILRLAQNIGNTGSFIIEVDEENLSFRGSESAYRIMETKMDTLLTLEQVVERVTPDSRAELRASLNKALVGQANELEFKLEQANGKVKHLKASLLPQLDGRPPRIIGALIDITPFKEITEQLRISEARFDSALKGSRDGIWDWDLQTNEMYVSDRWKNMLGYEVSELDNGIELLWDLVHPDDLEATRRAIEGHIKGESDVYSKEIRMKTKSGEYKWILSRGQVVRDENGNATRLIGTHADIDTLKKAQSELDEKRSNLRAIIENTNDLIWSVDRELKLITYNDRYSQEFESAFQHSAQPGVHAFQHFPSPDKENWIQWTQKAISGERVRTEYIFNWPNGAQYYDIYISPIEIGDSIAGAALYAKNITQRKLLELSAKRQEEALAQLYDAAIKIDSAEERFSKTLEIGCNFLEMDFGLINRVEGNEFVIANIYPEKGQ